MAAHRLFSSSSGSSILVVVVAVLIAVLLAPGRDALTVPCSTAVADQYCTELQPGDASSTVCHLLCARMCGKGVCAGKLCSCVQEEGSVLPDLAKLCTTFAPQMGCDPVTNAIFATLVGQKNATVCAAGCQAIDCGVGTCEPVGPDNTIQCECRRSR